MSNQPNDGGPAFPRPASQHSGPQEGMSLRDWFAGQALAGYLAIEDHRSNRSGDPDEIAKWREECIQSDADFCFKYADAMLKARGGDAP